MNEKLLYLCSAWLSRLIRITGSSKKSFERIIVIKQDEIGDMVTALHVFKYLHKAYPTAEIHLKCRKVNRILFKHIPYVQPVESLEDRKYDLIVDLRGDWRSLIYALTHWPTYRVDRGTVRMRNKFSGGQRNELDTNFEIIAPLLSNDITQEDNSIIISSEEEDRILGFLKDKGIANFALLHLGARDASRRWPVERFAKVIDHLNNKGLKCLLVGGPDDIPINEECMALSPSAMNIAGQFNLLEFSCLCSKAKVFIGNESGPLHIASANAIPLVALFGPGVKDVFYPKGEQVRIHHYFLDRGHKQQNMENSTIFRISVEEVIQSVDELYHG